MHIRHNLQQLVALLLIIGCWLPNARANQRLLDRVNALNDEYTQQATGELRASGYRILHREVHHHTQLLKLVRQSNVYVRTDIENFFSTAAKAGAELRVYIHREVERTERKVRLWRANTIAKVDMILNETNSAAGATPAQVAQIEVARKEMARMPPIFENAVRKVHTVISEAGPKFAEEHDQSTAAVLELHAKALLDKKGVHRREYAAKYMLTEELAIDALETAMKESGQRILGIWNEYAAQTFESKSFLWALRNVDD